MDPLTLISNIVVALVWPSFLTIMLIRPEPLVKILSSITNSFSNNKLELEVFGQKLNLNLNEIQRTLVVDLEEIIPIGKLRSPVPYVTYEEFNRIISRINTMKLLLFPIEKIDHLSILKCMGGYYYSIRDLPNAVKYYEKAREISAQSGVLDQDIHSCLGFSYLSNKNFKLAEFYFKKIPFSDPIYPWGELGQGLCYLGIKSGKTKTHLQTAEDQFEKQINDSPPDSWLHFGRGLSELFQKKYKESISSFDKAFEIDPQFFLACYNRAIAKLKSGYSNEDSCDDLRIAINLNPIAKKRAIDDKDFISLRKERCYECLLV